MKLLNVAVNDGEGGTKNVLIDVDTITDHHAATNGTTLCGSLKTRIPATRVITKDGGNFKVPMPHEKFVAEMAAAGQRRVTVRDVQIDPLPLR